MAGRASICQSIRFRNNQRGKLVSDLARCVTRSGSAAGAGVFNYKELQRYQANATDPFTVLFAAIPSRG